MARLATKTFTASGSFTLPAGVTTCKVLLYGGGGAGGASVAGTSASATNPSCGGAGGGGALCVGGGVTGPNGTSLTIVVGNGGAGGAGSGAAGTVSSVANGGTVLVQAPGASGGQIGKAGAAVGATSFGGPPVTFAGANPANYVSGTQILNAYFPTPLGPSYGGLTETLGAGTTTTQLAGGDPPLAFGNFIGGQPGPQGPRTTDPGGGGGGDGRQRRQRYGNGRWRGHGGRLGGGEHRSGRWWRRSGRQRHDLGRGRGERGQRRKRQGHSDLVGVRGPEKRLYPVAFKGGIDTKTDPKQVIPGKLLDLQNGIFSQTGLVDSRWGYTALGTGIIGGLTNISKCAAVEGSYNNELLMYDGQNAYSYIAANNAWANRGEVVSVIQTNQQITSNSAQQLSPDSATLGGIQVYAWEDPRGGIRYSVVDQASGAFIVVDQPLFAGMPSALYRPRVVASSALGLIFIFYVTADGSIGSVQINPLNPTSPNAPAILLSSLGASGLGTGIFIDVAPAANGNIYLSITGITGGTGPIWYVRASLVGSQLVAAFVNQGFSGRTATFPPGGDAGLVDSFGAIWIVWAVQPVNSGFPWAIRMWAVQPAPSDSSGYGGFGSGTGVTVMQLPSTATPTAITLTVAAGNSSGNGVATLFVETAGSSGNVIYTQTVNASTFALGVSLLYPIASCPVFARGCGLASKAFTFGGNVYVNVATQSQQQSTYFTLDQTGNVVAKSTCSAA